MNPFGIGLTAIGVSQILHIALGTKVTIDTAGITLCIGVILIAFSKRR